jgi:RIO kinase 1
MLFDQFVTGVMAMSTLGIVHGDLSPYNMLVWHDRLYFIDFPQAVDPIANSDGVALLERDVTHVCAFFERRGVTVDCGALLGDLVREIFQ